jgi:glutamate-ammonia-ligase adenylyltransferase
MDVLMKMLSSSQYFADILVRDPELFRWLTASDALIRPRTKEILRAEVERTMRLFQKPERKMDGLRRLYRRETLRIGARDVLGEADLATVTRELSHLADVLIDASCQIAQQQMCDRIGKVGRQRIELQFRY